MESSIKSYLGRYKAESIEVAEMSKLLENSYRSVNIGLVNELKIICDEINIPINQVIKAASTKPLVLLVLTLVLELEGIAYPLIHYL